MIIFQKISQQITVIKHLLTLLMLLIMIYGMLKISFSGIPGSGRSSIAAEVRKILALKSKVALINPVNRKNPFDDHMRSTFESQFFYISTQINEENSRIFTPNDYLICDQSVLDQWVSWLLAKEHQKGSGQKILGERHQVLQTLFHHWIFTYDLVFFIRVSRDIYEQRENENSLRQINEQDLERREQIYLKTIREVPLSIIEIWNNTTVDEAALSAVQHIQEHQKLQSPRVTSETMPQ